MEIAIRVTEFGITAEAGINRNTDTVDAAVNLAEKLEDDPLIALLQDLSAGGVTILVSGDPEQQTFAEGVLDLLEINATPCPPRFKGRVLDPKELGAWCSDQAYVVDPEASVQLIRAEMLIAQRPPRKPEAFRRVIGVGWDSHAPPETPVLVIKSGCDKAMVRAVGVSSSRFYGDVTNILTKLASQVGSQRPAIVLPSLPGGLTTLEEEIAFLESALGWRLFGYRHPEGQVPGSILQVVLAHCEEDVEVSTAARGQLRNIIAEHVRAGQPVPISISLAVGTRIPNPLKFFERVQLPTFAWLHLAWFGRLVSEKVETFYPPGVRFLIFDEASLFADLIPGLTPEGVRQHLAATRTLIEMTGSPIDVIEVTLEMLPAEKVDRVKVTVGNDVIYAIACSLPEMVDEEVMADLYVVRDRPYGRLRQWLGPLWGRAEGLAVRVNQALTLRKQIGLFSRLARELFGIQGPLIDACITDKTERLVLDVTSNALLNHGMPVVYRDKSGRYSVHIVPEYRIKEEHPGAQPVRISPSEFGLEGKPFVFYYLGK